MRIRVSSFLRLTIIVFLLLFLISTSEAGSSVRHRSVTVSNVNELYSAINDPANTGSDISLLPGTYRLSALDLAGSARPNGGRLELQDDMSLSGLAGDRGAVVIDASGLPNTSFTAGSMLVGVIRVGRGHNSVEWLTIQGQPVATGSIDATLFLPRQKSGFRVAHVTSTGSLRGVDARNFQMPNRILFAEIEDNEFFEGFEGVRILNADASPGAVITAVMRNNYLHNNEHGCVIENTRTNSGKIYVTSNGDLLTQNGAGCLIGGGFIGSANSANSNYVSFEAHGTQIINNTGPRVFRWPGGIVASAGMTGLANAVSNNKLDIRLLDCKIYGNAPADLKLRGAFYFGTSLLLAGANNLTTVDLSGSSKFANIDAADSEPFMTTGNNRLIINYIPDEK